VNRYVIDELALAAVLGGIGTEHERREMSRLISDAAHGGPGLDMPALCVWAAEDVRSGIVDHVVGLIVDATPGAVEMCGLSRTPQLDSLTAWRQRAGWPAASAAAHALVTGQRVMTVKPGGTKAAARTRSLCSYASPAFHRAGGGTVRA
jgi:hypothetical protein